MLKHLKVKRNEFPRGFEIGKLEGRKEVLEKVREIIDKLAMGEMYLWSDYTREFVQELKAKIKELEGKGTK